MSSLYGSNSVWRPGALRLSALLLGLALLAGCQKSDLYSALSEQQANEMIVVLEGAGIAASKTPTRDGGWTVRIAPDRFSGAVQVLRANGYPKDEFASIGDIFKKKGIVSTPLEERARYVFGLSQELSSTLSVIDGVVTARIHLALPEEDPLAQTTTPASASVFIKHKPGVDLTPHVAAIKTLVVNSVEGVVYDNVSVALFAAQPMPSASRPGPKAAHASFPPVSAYSIAAIGGLALAGFAFGFARRRQPASTGAAGNTLRTKPARALSPAPSEETDNSDDGAARN
ncbi:MAG: type III secretion inner membrane ring lipoprotein SctJ [Pseudomonadota bacterium]